MPSGARIRSEMHDTAFHRASRYAIRLQRQSMRLLLA